jgi:carbonic anhydrase
MMCYRSPGGISPALLATAIGLMIASSVSLAAENTHWSYSGENGPERWSELSPDYAACGIGVNQSPVDITDTVAAELEPLVFDYRSHSIDIVNNGHTLQINAAPGSVLHANGKTFELLQLHFHSPSEHRINGEAFPLEAHLVHQDEQGALAVVAILFRKGAWNEDLDIVGQASPRIVGQSAPFDINIGDFQLYRSHESYFRYSGSLTTPPCTEGIRWYILKTVETVDPQQAANFVSWIGEDARGPQPLNARVILEH